MLMASILLIYNVDVFTYLLSWREQPFEQALCGMRLQPNAFFQLSKYTSMAKQEDPLQGKKLIWRPTLNKVLQ